MKFARGSGAWCLIEIVLDQFSDQVIAVMIKCSRWNATFARLVDARHARLHDYLARMQAQPAYRRAVDRGGAYAFDAASADGGRRSRD